MGIPKFFRFISERWPYISQLVDDSALPEFDNLYLDMNSILHTCTHLNDNELTLNVLPEQTYAAIFAYIDHLFLTIKPQKTFYMAIDGVAPRAKMNQQRARRFRTAVEAEQLKNKALAAGEELPKEGSFDLNSITPGTEFMANLTTNLKYFVHKKVSEDAAWQNVEIILSGHEVPGEGEHKIMEYIRVQKSQDNYDPNLRHCIYGLDADLIMLGLISHEPHFALLREEVTFGRSRTQQLLDVKAQPFYLLHLLLVREYLGLEFADLADQLSFGYDFDRVLDDFILVMYVIGNDFLPNLPDLHINKGAFPLLIATFKQALRALDGYLSDNGTINFPRLGAWLELLAKFELSNFEQVDVDVEWFNMQLENVLSEGKRKRERSGKELVVGEGKKIVGAVKLWLLPAVDAFGAMPSSQPLPEYVLPEGAAENLDFLRKFAFDIGCVVVNIEGTATYKLRLDVDGLPSEESPEDFAERVVATRTAFKPYQSGVVVSKDQLEEQSNLYLDKFVKWKNLYYKSKLGFTLADTSAIKLLTHNYLEGLQWVLYYYYRGCQLWGWYYHYHYAPRILDVAQGLDVVIDFDFGTPFHPYEQLMAVLPARSLNLIPPAYRPLMLEPHSPIADFYPHDVKTDKNGKTADWEAVVLLSFVDEKRLKEAMTPYTPKLTAEEVRRNQFGSDLVFTFLPQHDTVYPSSLPGVFAPLEHDRCIEQAYRLPPHPDVVSIGGLVPGVRLGREALPGFPSLYTLPFSAELRPNQTVVFQQPSRSESMVLTLENAYSLLTPTQVAEKYLGQLVYTRFPFLRESKVVKVSDGTSKWERVGALGNKKVKQSPLDQTETRDFNAARSNFVADCQRKKAFIIGRVSVLVYVKPVTGLMRTPRGAYVKTFSKVEEPYPIQLVVDSINETDPRFRETAPLPVDQEFPLGSHVVCTGSVCYGAPAEVVGHNVDQGTLNLHVVTAPPEPQVGAVVARKEHYDIRYFPNFVVAKQLGVLPLFLLRITSLYMVDGAKHKINLGLEIKFEAKRQKVLGYARRAERGWEFSLVATALLREYAQRFPRVWNGLKNLKANIPTAKDIFGVSDPKELDKEVTAVKLWLKGIKASFVVVGLESESLTRAGVAAVEHGIEAWSLKPVKHVTKAFKNVPRHAVLDPAKSYQLLSTQRFALGDRVVYVQASGSVPVFSKGTAVGVMSQGSKVTVQVVFDDVLVAGNKLDGRLRTVRGGSVDLSVVLNLSNVQIGQVGVGKKALGRAANAAPANGKVNGKAKPEAKSEAKSQASVPVKGITKDVKKTVEKGKAEKPKAEKPKAEKPKAEKPKAKPKPAGKSAKAKTPPPSSRPPAAIVKDVQPAPKPNPAAAGLLAVLKEKPVGDTPAAAAPAAAAPADTSASSASARAIYGAIFGNLPQ